MSWCKQCHKAYYLARRAADPEAARAREAEKRAANREQLNAYQREWKAKNKEKTRAHRLKARYGITVEQYDEMLEAQGGGCAVCGGIEKLFIDHCHDTGKVRGVLCHWCNVALGYAQNDAARLRKLAEYIETYRSGRAPRQGERCNVCWPSWHSQLVMGG